MKIRLYPIVLPLMLALAACVTDYTKSEAPNNLRVDGAETRREFAFATGSAYLTPGELRKLDGWVLSGSIRPADRVAPDQGRRAQSNVSGSLPLFPQAVVAVASAGWGDGNTLVAMIASAPTAIPPKMSTR